MSNVQVYRLYFSKVDVVLEIRFPLRLDIIYLQIRLVCKGKQFVLVPVVKRPGVLCHICVVYVIVAEEELTLIKSK